ncbi:MAG TPA: hypothetical protein VGD17_00475 [Chitinophagaceae bacterium]
MRTAFTSFLLVAAGCAANAQFSLTPKAGLESSRTSIRYNNENCLSPLGAYVSPQIGLRMDYKFKKTHGPYIGLSTTRQVVAFRFDDPETAATTYSAAAGNRQVRIEGGYTLSTKPIYFSKSASNKAKAIQSAKESAPVKKGCGKYSRSAYASKSSCGNKSKAIQQLAKNKAWNVRIQPSAGLAYIPGLRSDITTDANGANYQYNAGNWKTAVVTGIDFEFARGRDRVMVLGFQYLKGIGNLDSRSITTQSLTKSTTTTTHFDSRSSAWNVTLGVPFTLSKSKSSASKQPRTIKQTEVKKQCIYKSPCRKRAA